MSMTHIEQDVQMASCQSMVETDSAIRLLAADDRRRMDEELMARGCAPLPKLLPREEQREVFACIVTAMHEIEQAHVWWSEELRRHIRLQDYEGLEWYAAKLGIGLVKADTEDAILQATQHFKLYLDQLYPGWQSPQEGPQVEMEHSEPTVAASDDGLDTPLEEEEEAPSEPTGEDCRCSNHTGPHWLYDDYWWYKNNLQHLERCAKHVQRFYELYLTRDHDPTAVRQALVQRMWAFQASDAFMTEEGPRLQEKIWEMEARGLRRITYDVLGPGYTNLQERESTLLATINQFIAKLPGAHHARSAGDER